MIVSNSGNFKTAEGTAILDDDLVFTALLEKVYRVSGYDFRDYKRGTIVRRLERRLHVTGSATYADYMRFLDLHPEEYRILVDYFTIQVSGFFRTPFSFQQVARLVLPELLADKKNRGNREMRFWSTACARGEEAYSIAVMLAEFMGQRRFEFEVTIRATDVNSSALGEAESASYLPKDLTGVPPDILRRYFIQRHDYFEPRVNIRQMVDFSHFDLTSTTLAPFNGLDCIFCCNVLIYLRKPLQEKVLTMLYEALAVPGYLILGEAETPVSGIREKLECLDGKAKIYKKTTG